jgi:hypothetical protein
MISCISFHFRTCSESHWQCSSDEYDNHRYAYNWKCNLCVRQTWIGRFLKDVSRWFSQAETKVLPIPQHAVDSFLADAKVGDTADGFCSSFLKVVRVLLEWELVIIDLKCTSSLEYGCHDWVLGNESL